MAVAKKNPTSAIENAIRAWMNLHMKLAAVTKPIERYLDEAKDRVVTLIGAAGLTTFDSKFGKISLQTKTTIDWEGIARSVGTAEQIEALKPKFTSESEAFVRAPQSWSGKAS